MWKANKSFQLDNINNNGAGKKSKENNSKFKFASKLYLSLLDPIDMFTWTLGIGRES